MKNKLFYLLSIFFISISSSSYAIDINFDINNQEKEKLNNDFNVINNELKDIFNKVMALTEDSYQQKMFILSEDTWLQHRELDCKASKYNLKDDPSYPIEYTRCLYDYTKQRIIILQNMINK